MRPRIFSILFLISFVVLPLLFGYNNCAGPKNSEPAPAVQEDQFSSIPGLPEVNYFKTEMPAQMSGFTGYQYLLKEYFGPQCALCHRQNGPWDPKFAEMGDMKASYLAAKNLIPTNNMIRRITLNAACGPQCNLDQRGQVYKAI